MPHVAARFHRPRVVTTPVHPRAGASLGSRAEPTVSLNRTNISPRRRSARKRISVWRFLGGLLIIRERTQPSRDSAFRAVDHILCELAAIKQTAYPPKRRRCLRARYIK